MKKSPKKENIEDITKNTEIDLIAKHFKELLETDVQEAVWFKKRLADIEARIIQNRKILEKLKII
jgi:hypothetical protein